MGVSERRKREKEARRELILQAAGELFSDRGFKSTTIDEIAEKAELGKGTIYTYFDSKEAILLALLTSSLEKLGDDLDAVQEEGLDLEQTLGRAAAAFTDFHEARKGMNELMLIQVNQSWDDFPPELVEAHGSVLVEILETMSGLLEKVAGETGAEIEDPMGAAMLFLAMDVGVFAVTRMSPPRLSELVDKKGLYNRARRLLVRGVLGLEPPAGGSPSQGVE